MMKITDKKCPVCGCDSFIVNEHYNYSIDHKQKIKINSWTLGTVSFI
jgi:endogenous inhibitor of DNA gyrase (YacG/DUF329 family)